MKRRTAHATWNVCFPGSAVVQFEFLLASCVRCNGVILSAGAFQPERRISRHRAVSAREIPRPAGENAGARDDAL